MAARNCQIIYGGAIMDNYENIVEKIAKDIRDKQDKEMAVAFTNSIGKLLKDNGVIVNIERYDLAGNDCNKNTLTVERKYGFTIKSLDFTEHDKPFKTEIRELKTYIEKLSSIRTRCHEAARDLFDLGNYGCLHIVTADELKSEQNEETELPFDPLEVANMLINATYKCNIPFTGRKTESRKYGIDELEQIAEHLLVHCKHNKEEA